MPMEPAFCQHTRRVRCWIYLILLVYVINGKNCFQVILETAKSIDLNVRDGGTVVVIEGPRFSSKAESNVYRSWGAHLIGMTTFPEVRHL